MTTDITKTGLSAAPASNNTALVTLSVADANNKYVGEDGSEITINTVGSEISLLIGKTVAFKTTNNEYFKCFVKDATTLSRAFRGYFFDSSGSAVERANLSNGDTLTLMKLGWIFIENNGTVVDVTYNEPSMTFSAPSSPVTGDYWLDLTNQVWKRYSGTTWDIINRTLIGEFISDATSTVATRPIDYEKDSKELNNVELEISTVATIKTKNDRLTLNVYGSDIDIITSGFSWNITTDLDTGSEAADTLYYLYISDRGEPVVSIQKPFKRNDLEGWYHPHHSFRCVGAAFNDSSSDFVAVADYVGDNYVESGSSGSSVITSTSFVDILNLNVVAIYLDKTKNLNVGMEMEINEASQILFFGTGTALIKLDDGVNNTFAGFTSTGSSTAGIPPSATSWRISSFDMVSAKNAYALKLQARVGVIPDAITITKAKMYSRTEK